LNPEAILMFLVLNRMMTGKISEAKTKKIIITVLAGMVTTILMRISESDNFQQYFVSKKSFNRKDGHGYYPTRF
jgi:hypothetical protein